MLSVMYKTEVIYVFSFVGQARNIHMLESFTQNSKKKKSCYKEK
jgi:hypothetical protein